MLLALIAIARPASVFQALRQGGGQPKKRKLTGTIHHRRQFDGEWTVVHDLQDDRAAPARLNPWRRLMHAEPGPGIGASTLDNPDQISGHANRFVS